MDSHNEEDLIDEKFGNIDMSKIDLQKQMDSDDFE
jgi:hypothetical protein